MAIPPPPGPPRPPPPPAMGGLKLGGSATASVPSTDARSALLQSIQKGTKLKKTVTVDKSGPAMSGKVCGDLKSSSPPRRTNNNNSSNNSSPCIANGGPKLAGLFEGMTSMPKLKPVNGRGNVPSTRTNNLAQETKQQQQQHQQQENRTISSPQNNNGPMDFSAELTKHLTLKRQKQQINATEANLRTNRGPPPQPPIQKNISSSTSDSVLEKSSVTSSKSSQLGKASSPTLSEGSNSSSSNNSTRKNSNLSLSIGHTNVNSSSSTKMSTPLAQNLVPNKSTLFGTNSCNNSSSNISQNPSSSSSSSSSLLLATSKPVVNHGKPNCAPKPPGIQQLMSNGGKPTVSRHHSMKSPRSPPISAAGGSVFSAAQHFGTLRGPPQQFQSQESITSTTITMRPAPNPPLGRPTEAPPKPPSSKPAPPPIPARSISNTNLTNLPLSTTPSSINTFGSTNNVSNVLSIKEQLKGQISYPGSATNVSTITSNVLSTTIGGSGGGGGSIGKINHSPIHNRSGGGGDQKIGSNLNGISPVVPQHRTHPAPNPPQRQISSSTSLIPPDPPKRHSSIRSNSATATISSSSLSPSTATNLGKIGNYQQHHHNQSGGGNGGNIAGGLVNRLIVDIEMRFASRFHNVTEFPTPPPFLNSSKSYPSRNVNNVEIRKPRAPSPPSSNRQQGSSLSQLNEQRT